MKLEGKYCKDIEIFTDNIEEDAIKQIYEIAGCPEFKGSKIRIMPDVHSGKGIVIGFTAPLGKYVNPDHVGCVDRDTEVLTRFGWIKISNYKGEEILQYDPNTDNAEFKLPNAFIKLPEKQFYHFYQKDGTLDQMVSAEHNLLVYSGKSNKPKFNKYHPADLIKFKTIPKGYFRYKTTFSISKTNCNISDELIRVDVMIQADGHISYRKSLNLNHVELHFRKKRKIKRAKLLLKQAGIQYKLIILKDKSALIKFHIDPSFNKDLTKYYNADSRQLSIIAEECLNWDGHVGYRSYYSNTNKKNVDFIQFAFAASGNRASIYKHEYNNSSNNNTYYNVIKTRSQFCTYNRYPKIVDSIDGYKYCFNTDTGYFICRRRDNIFITGNCDISCGVSSVFFDKRLEPEMYEVFEHRVKQAIPMGMKIHQQRQFDVCEFLKYLRGELQKAYQKTGGLTYIYDFNNEGDLEEWLGDINMDLATFYKSIGTLGGGET